VVQKQPNIPHLTDAKTDNGKKTDNPGVDIRSKDDSLDEEFEAY